MKVISLVFRAALAAAFTAVCAACMGENLPLEENKTQAELQNNLSKPAAGPGVNADTVLTLERIAELERAGGFFPGLGLVESGLREKDGDFTGAALAAYKELAWAYGYGSAGRGQVEEGLQNALALLQNVYPSLDDSPFDALRGCMAFAREDWTQAEKLLAGISSSDAEPDSFLRWILLVCALEREDSPPQLRSAYSAIRGRYALFPEYWYRGARAFSKGNENVAVSFAEQCINISPQGPFSDECRGILSSYLGLASNGSDIRTRAEIENIIRVSVSMNNPGLLEELFPLMALPENPCTIYALGALKALAAVPEFRLFFVEEARKSPGRLGDRLNYLARG